MSIYLFSVNVTFLPSIISTRWLLSIPGAILLLIYYQKLKKRSFHYQKNMNAFWRSLFFFYFTIIIFGLFNGRFDGVYSSYPITIILITSASFCLVFSLNKIWNGIELKRYIWLLVMTCICHQLLSILMFFFPQIDDTVFSIIQQSALEERANELTMQNRFHTIGVAYFGAGVLYSYCILLIVIISQLNHKFIHGWFTSIIVVFLFAVGSAISRTTMMGLIIAISYIGLNTLLSNKSGKFKEIVKYLFGGTIVITLVIILFNKYIANNYLLEAVSEHAFEGIFNLIETGKFTTTSSDKMFASYTWPDNMWTWLIGDARLKGIDEYSYYKFTDIGWCRLIFDFGILGTIAFIFMQWKLLQVVFIHRINYSIVFVLYISFLFKGLSELTIYFMPAAMVWLFKEPNRNIDL